MLRFSQLPLALPCPSSVDQTAPAVERGEARQVGALAGQRGRGDQCAQARPLGGPTAGAQAPLEPLHCAPSPQGAPHRAPRVRIAAHKLLEEALGKSAVAPTANTSSINCIVITSGSLIPSLVKCLLYCLDDVVSSENVYSSWEVGKLQCFKWIKERFDSPNVRFCAIGDGHEECSAAQVMKWPFIKIEFRPVAPHRFPGLDMPTVQMYMNHRAKMVDQLYMFVPSCLWWRSCLRKL